LGIFSFNPYFSRPNKTVNSSNMDFKQIQELIKMINKSNIGEVSIEEKGFKLTIKQKEEPVQQIIAAPVQAHPIAAVAAMPAAAGPAPSAAAEKSARPVEPPVDNTVTIKSPAPFTGVHLPISRPLRMWGMRSNRVRLFALSKP